MVEWNRDHFITNIITEHLLKPSKLWQWSVIYCVHYREQTCKYRESKWKKILTPTKFEGWTKIGNNRLSDTTKKKRTKERKRIHTVTKYNFDSQEVCACVSMVVRTHFSVKPSVWEHFIQSSQHQSAVWVFEVKFRVRFRVRAAFSFRTATERQRCEWIKLTH